jgi:hypothetical protein
MRRELVTWGVTLALIIAAFVGTVLILNASLYSASGFVRSYLDALERHDADGALQLTGAHGSGAGATGDASRELLVPAAMGTLSDIRLLSDSSGADGVHHVRYAYTAGTDAGQTVFDVRRAGTLLGLFPTWEFASSPLGVLQLTVQHANTFNANRLALATPAQNQAVPYLVFTPSSIDLTHESTLLAANPVNVFVTDPHAVTTAALDIEANVTFVLKVRDAVSKSLDSCTTQPVLLPTGCPFGEAVANRIVSTPTWSMSRYPQITLAAGNQPNTWVVPPTDGDAHLIVDVKSLFDGTISTFDEDVPFTASYAVAILAGNQVAVSFLEQ